MEPRAGEQLGHKEPFWCALNRDGDAEQGSCVSALAGGRDVQETQRVSTGSAREVCQPKLHLHTPGAHQEPGNPCKALWTSKWKEKNPCEHKHMYTCTHGEFWRGIKSQPSNQKLLKGRGLDAQLVNITHPPTKPEEIGQRNIC